MIIMNIVICFDVLIYSVISYNIVYEVMIVRCICSAQIHVYTCRDTHRHRHTQTHIHTQTHKYTDTHRHGHTLTHTGTHT